ncbi:vanadium-dependent haloperoxidase [Chitinophaga vietnamensis]|uniref:vanadium-dependent haloperoxidase n=1 Tax=Chitinophaga vietnamensis TaxID=2593957 RepID=UPI001177C717|nr:vanadium-dependent haloperoxidase [Chitinophaga vietnamensis]
MKTPTKFLLLFLFACVLFACKRQDTPPQPAPSSRALTESLSSGNASVPVSWYQLELKLITETPGFTPPVAARAIAYTGVTLHEAVVNGIWGYPTLSGQLNGLSQMPAPDRGKTYSWAIAANSAMAAIIRQLFPNASAANDTLIAQLEVRNHDSLAATVPADVAARSVSFGQQIASAIYQWSLGDGGKDGYLNNFPTDYVPPVGPGLWTPTPPAFQRAMLPYWGNNRLMVRSCVQDTGNILPPSYSTDTSSAFYQSAYGVYQISKTATPEQVTIAKYWADGGGTFTPPGHMLAIATQLAMSEGLSLNEAARLFAQIGIGLNDAGIVCWKYKYKYNLLRPVSYIRDRIDSSWLPLIVTPPFPSYTSGHATFSGAAGQILAANFGNGFSFTDYQKVPAGFAPRSFSSFSAMVDEAAISRVYGGIHYDFDSETGKQTGSNIGIKVLSLRF